MAKVTPRRRQRRPEKRETNWMLIGGIVAVGVIGLFALLFLTLQGQGTPTPTPVPEVSSALEDYCAANEDACFAMGEPDAPVTVVEISDYMCPHCRNFNLDEAPQFEEAYVNTGNVRWVVLPFALDAQRIPGAASALCAADQDSFYEYHRGLFEIQDTGVANTRAGFVQVADSLGLDMNEFEQCIDSGQYESVVQDNIARANVAGVSATPTFFVNGVKVEGNAPALIRQEIETSLGS